MISLRQSCVLLSICCALAAQGADWPKWRGPDGAGRAASSEKPLDKLPPEPKVIWKIKAGEGLASPVVADGKVFHFDAVQGKETLHALDAATAKELWQHTVDDTFKDNQGPPGPRCTPLVDGERVYAVSCKGELQCLETATGKLIWRTNYTNDFGAVFIGEKGNIPGAARHGNNGSPLIVGDRLYAVAGGMEGASVVCFEKSTGKVVWKSQNDQAAYAPPVMATLGGIEQVICFTADGLIGLKSLDGALLWRVPMKTAYARHVTTPVVWKDVVVAGSHTVGLVGTRISKDGEGLKAEQAWLSKEAAMNFSSPVLAGQHLYGLGPAKNLVCLDAETGKLAWSETGYFNTSPDKAHGGFLVLGENILALTDGGEAVLFPANPAGFKELGRVQVCGVNWCNPAYANGVLYVRDGIKNTGELAAVRLAE